MKRCPTRATAWLRGSFLTRYSLDVHSTCSITSHPWNDSIVGLSSLAHTTKSTSRAELSEKLHTQSPSFARKQQRFFGPTTSQLNSIYELSESDCNKPWPSISYSNTAKTNNRPRKQHKRRSRRASIHEWLVADCGWAKWGVENWNSTSVNSKRTRRFLYSDTRNQSERRSAFYSYG